MPADSQPRVNVGIIVLAAGLGRRYAAAGGRGQKLLAPYPDSQGALRPLLALVLANAVVSGLPVRLVTRPEAIELIALARQWPLEITQIESAGSGESIAAGVAATPDWQGWIIQPGDMPWVKPGDYQRVAAALAESHRQARIVWQGLPGHPVGFGAEWRAKLLALEGDNGARSLLDRERLILLPGSAGNLLDADLPTD